MNLLTSKQVLEITGIGCRSTLWRAVKASTFPSPLILGPRSIRWRSDEVDTWINERPRRTYKASAQMSMEA
ncbi:AlpA family phage regulatory protein [uncultured Brevundimonas sp.]|uniref:helix-turn-helix transcriptional regulator n=1 Tax=uncultured Brevundimonas sp. TaxID=213418 RepID=UPI00341BD91B